MVVCLLNKLSNSVRPNNVVMSMYIIVLMSLKSTIYSQSIESLKNGGTNKKMKEESVVSNCHSLFHSNAMLHNWARRNFC